MRRPNTRARRRAHVSDPDASIALEDGEQFRQDVVLAPAVTQMRFSRQRFVAIMGANQPLDVGIGSGQSSRDRLRMHTSASTAPEHIGHQTDLERIIVAFDNFSHSSVGRARACLTASRIPVKSALPSPRRAVRSASTFGFAAGNLDNQVVAQDRPRWPIVAGRLFLAPGINLANDGQSFCGPGCRPRAVFATFRQQGLQPRRDA